MAREEKGWTVQSALEVPGAKWTEVTQITTPPFDSPYAEECKEKLKQHGCQIKESQEYYIITFPPGTQKIQIRLTTTVIPYQIRFSDGYSLYETYDRFKGISYLKFPREEKELNEAEQD